MAHQAHLNVPVARVSPGRGPGVWGDHNGREASQGWFNAHVYISHSVTSLSPSCRTRMFVSRSCRSRVVRASQSYTYLRHIYIEPKITLSTSHLILNSWHILNSYSCHTYFCALITYVNLNIVSMSHPISYSCLIYTELTWQQVLLTWHLRQAKNNTHVTPSLTQYPCHSYVVPSFVLVSHLHCAICCTHVTLK